ncbi:aminoglycoside phosphotransferase family protein [Agaribacterium sp. ZY112]|uniref:aminoglycoside phosphotransferase family protein n=1 Tax=Agaribacterium sp. ZY112 TaxID=3233574 RepID=UPI003524686C
MLGFAERSCEAALIELKSKQLKPLSGDAGARRYYRLDTQAKVLLVDAPPESENSERFCAVASWLSKRGLRVPKILAHDSEQGFLLLEDLGDALLQAQLNEDTVDTYYAEAMSMLLHLQASELDAALFPAYDRALLQRELDLFDEWFLTHLLSFELNVEQQAALAVLKQMLIESAISEPQVIVHRDFHSRNLLLLADESLATIDFQDAVYGPLSYDLVSLLKDCYIDWPRERVERWALTYASLAADAGLMPAQGATEFLRSFDLMGLQRHLKVLGIFARLSLRDGKHHYLQDLPRVLAYVLEVLSLYDEAGILSSLFADQLSPTLSTRLQSLAS